MTWKPAFRATLTLFGDPVCVRPTVLKQPDILVDAGRSMVRRLLREIPDFFDDDDDEVQAMKTMVDNFVSIGLRETDGDQIARRLERMGWSDLCKDDTVMEVFDYWYHEIDDAERRAQESWADENGVEATFQAVTRARLMEATGWASCQQPLMKRAAAIFVAGDAKPEITVDGLLRRGRIVALEDLEVEL